MESMYKKHKKDNTALIQHFQEKQVGRLVFSRKAATEAENNFKPTRDQFRF